ncbi:MAG: bifunctional oligoribonuclease/PAP phosphatase NrnA [Bacteroidales bacterium]|jgi:phosphoesterase RecJ-like protein|nr:bifunctional oligoribonuclease/PAP phosphatase NrnA [Bacteroidales bacterium]
MIGTENEILKSVGQFIAKKCNNIVIMSHENPDGDAVGSAVGLAEILQNNGHNVSIIFPNDYPYFLKWFSSKIEILIYDNQKKNIEEKMKKADLLFCLDFNEVKRAGKLKKQLLEFSKPKILIDHHLQPSLFCDYIISEPSYCSTAELIFDTVHKLNLASSINYNAAEALYTGILTDTGSFSHNISRANVFRVVSELLRYGINADKIHSNIYHNFSVERMKLLGYCLNEKMEILTELRTAVISLTKEEQAKYNFQIGDYEGFVNYPLSIKNIVFSALFIEKEGLVKASFRSKGSFPSNKFSKDHFNGGGHLNAAGGESSESLDETLGNFKHLLMHYKHQLINTKI